MSLDAAVDIPSGTSLSFASFVSEHDKQSIPGKMHFQPPLHEEKASQEFEFSCVLPERYYSANNSNGHLQHQREYQYCSGPGQSNHRRSAITESSLDRSTEKLGTGVKMGTEKRHNPSAGFAQRIIKSLACKDCRVIEPTHCVVQPATRLE
ncbi:OLC1v1021477C1 [Oldenlandia corymbosa var. corymbosa]|uniref:OLC1v1021477C1 n=1 Tax=Oldenlandia corymbosa var. corymbosa TaxID=529605 RepID=A0AAV1BWC8_OLDCO|nr:OLC1v1021477C1 [Oldenlandia corymbosa var. corymbosa]